MSRENVELLRQAFDAVNRRDLDGLLALMDPDVEAVEVRDLGDLALAVLRMHAHGAGSDIPIEQALWLVTEWRDKKIARWSAYEAEALETVVLRE